MKKGRKIKSQLPEAMIQHIQSFLSGKEAAQTSILSKSWYNAWLTRPSIHFDQRDFKYHDPYEFVKFTTKTINRYKDLNLKVDSFTLQIQSRLKRRDILLLAKQLILDAIKMGAVDLNLEFRPSSFVLPEEVLTSVSLLRLSVKGCAIEFDGNVTCSSLKSLRLHSVFFKNEDVVRDLFSCCISLEELSLLNSVDSIHTSNLWLDDVNNLCKLHELRRLYLEGVQVFPSFFCGFKSRFPCLKELSLVRCHRYSRMHIVSTSLQRISIVAANKKVFEAEFNVPNLAYFSYSGVGIGIPSISIDARARQWESYISIECSAGFYSSSWYIKLRKLLKQLSLSRLTLSLNVVDGKGDVIVVEPVVVEDLIIEAPPFDSVYNLFVGLFWICRPKFVTHYWLPESCIYWEENNYSLNKIWEKLMKEVLAPNRGVREQDIFGRFGLKKAKLEVYEEILSEWRPVVLKEFEAWLDAARAPSNKRKIRFEFKW